MTHSLKEQIEAIQEARKRLEEHAYDKYLDDVLTDIIKYVNGAREEWFSRSLDIAADYLEASNLEESARLKERYLSITYDKISELLTRVEELESKILTIIDICEQYKTPPKITRSE